MKRVSEDTVATTSTADEVQEDRQRTQEGGSLDTTECKG